MTETLVKPTCEMHTGVPGKGKHGAAAHCDTCRYCGSTQCSTPGFRWNDNSSAHIDCELTVQRSSHDLYPEGARYRVVATGARLEGFLLHGEELVSGWSRPLIVGEVLTCQGWQVVDVGSMTIYGTQWTGAKVPESAASMQVWPFKGLFIPVPMDGVLIPYVEDSGEDLVAILDQIEEGHEVDLTEYLKDTSSLVAAADDDEVVDLSAY